MAKRLTRRIVGLGLGVLLVAAPLAAAGGPGGPGGPGGQGGGSGGNGGNSGHGGGSPAGGVDIVIDGNEVSATINLPGGIASGFLMEFEEVVGLTEANLGLTASLVNPTDPALRARLPSGGTSIPLIFPLLIRIEPPAEGGLSFSGVVAMELHTLNLLFTLGTPLRLFAAPLDGPFEDVTAGLGMGSYRARADRGGFSEFIVVIDLRNTNSVVQGKFAALRARLEEYEPLIAPAVFSDLEELLDDAEDAYDARSYLAAANHVESFAAAVEAASGTDIPDVWRSARDLVNAGGNLRGMASTLRFSILLRRSWIL